MPISRDAGPSRASATATPTTRLTRLPIGSRFAAGSSPAAPSRQGLTALPRLAPSTSANAASGVTMPRAAKLITSSTTATEECAAQVRIAARITSTSGCAAAAPSSRLKLGTFSKAVNSDSS